MKKMIALSIFIFVLFNSNECFATRYKNKRVFTIPASKVEQVNSALERHGYGPDNFSVALTNPSGNIVTHYACEMVLTDTMLEIIRRAIPAGGKEHNKKFKDVLRDENLERKKR